MPQIAPLVFVSSTTEDLAEYRKAILYRFPALDVLFRGMEFFGARPHRARDVIHKELLGCDLYLGILAYRYGARDRSGLSFTELEYRAANKNEIPRLMFLIDDDHAVSAARFEVDLEGQRRLKDFKDAVRRETVVETFTTPEDLASKVAESLGNFIRDKAQTWQQLRHVPLNGFDNDYIRQLYSADPLAVRHAIAHVSTKVECRAAFEHLYSLLQTVDPCSDLVEKLLVQLILSQDESRVSQMLVNLLEDRPLFRPAVVHAIGQRALVSGRSLSDEEVNAVVGLVDDTDPEVRGQVANALGKIAGRRSDRWAECRKRIEFLKNDSVETVRTKAKVALRRTALPGPQDRWSWKK